MFAVLFLRTKQEKTIKQLIEMEEANKQCDCAIQRNPNTITFIAAECWKYDVEEPLNNSIS